MSLYSWLRSVVRPFNLAARSKPAGHFSRQLRLEMLEDRALLSVTSEPFQLPQGELSQVIPNVAGSVPISTSTLIARLAPTHEAGDFYWADGEQIPLLRRDDAIIVKLLPDANKADVLTSVSAQTGLGVKSDSAAAFGTDTLLLSNLTTENTSTDLFSSVKGIIQSLPGIGWAAPVLVTADTFGGVYLTEEMVVALKPGVDPKEFFADGFSSWSRFFDNQYIATVATGGGLASLQTANELTLDKRVEWATPNFYTEIQTSFTPNDSLYTNQWTLNNSGQTGALNNGSGDANLPAAWDITRGGTTPAGSFRSRVVIAVLDQGVQLDHPDLPIWINQGEIPTSTKSNLVDIDGDVLFTFADLNNAANSGYVTDSNSNGRIDANDLLVDTTRWANSNDGDNNGYVDDLFGWDFAGNDLLNPVGFAPDNNPNPTTQHDNHGTAVAGVAGAVGNNNLGVSGAAQNVLIMPIKIGRLDSALDSGFVAATTIAKAVYYAAGVKLDGSDNPTSTRWPAADLLVNSWSLAASTTLSNAFSYIQTEGPTNNVRNGLGVASFVSAGNNAAGTVPALNYQKIELPVTGGPSVTKQYVWSYQLNGDAFIDGENRAWVADITLPNGTHELLDTDNTLTDWTSPGAQPWTVVDDPTHAYGTARWVARAGQLTQPNQQSNLFSPVINVSSNSTISFARYVSSQFSSSTVNDPLALFEITNGGTPVVIWEDAGNPLPTRLVAYPANLSSTIAVGASTDWDYRAAYSQFGPALDFVAPSGGGYGAVYTTDRTGEAGYNKTGTNDPGGDPLSDLNYMSTFGGTSAATPLAAGIAALMLSKNPSLTATQIRLIMRNTADRIGGNNGATAYVANFNQYYGYGRVNAEAALNATPWAGDYNNNSVVDAPDYTVWRDFLGSSVTLPNDITPGTVTPPDYDVWKANFGRTSTNPQGSGTAIVPGDYNVDGVVGDTDYGVWEANFGSTTQLAADGNFNGVVDLADFSVWQEMRNVTTMTVIPGDFNGDGLVDLADHALWVAQDPLADADGDQDVDGDDLVIWEDHFGMTNAGVYPATLIGNGGPPLRVASQSPRVAGVRLGGSNSTHDDFDFASVDGSGEQLRTVPVGGLDTIHLMFSEEVLVTQGALTLTGLQSQAIPSVSGFTYDLATQTATWQFAAPLAAGQYLFTLNDSVFDLDHDALDGEFDNPWALADAVGTSDTFPSGDGEAGGDFRFRFTNLPADASRDNLVSTRSFPYRAWFGRGAGQPVPSGDATGNGYVDGADLALLGSSWQTDYTNWVSAEPGLILVSTLMDENSENPSATSLREALAIAKSPGQPGHDTIVFADNLFASGMATITLGAAGQLVLDSNVTIVGPGAGELIINRNGTTGRIFQVDSGVEATIRGVTISGGNGVSTGGGIYVNGTLRLESSVVEDNLASSNGGGLFINSSAWVEIVDSTIDDNDAVYGGGIFMYVGEGERLKIFGSTISNNTASGTGGGINLFGADTGSPRIVTIVNSTVSNNSGPGGSGIRARYSKTELNIINSTIAENDASSGGALYLVNSPKVTLHNTIVADNTNGGTTSNNITGTLQAASSYNLVGIGGGSGGLNANLGNIILTSGTVGLAPLGDYGGPTKTHALEIDSPAIDHGSDAQAKDAAGNPLAVDQRGFARFIDDPNTTSGAGSTVDIGAFEFLAPIIVSTTTDESDGNYAAGDLSLREALMLAATLDGDDKIVFDATMFSTPQTIALTFDGADYGTTPDQLLIDSDTTIDGPGVELLTIDGNNQTRVFQVSADVATIRGLRITGGYFHVGGAGINSTNANLTLRQVDISGNDNLDTGAGGLYANGGSVTVVESTIDGNNGAMGVGGLYAANAPVTIVGSAISNNSGIYGGAWLGGGSNPLRIINSTISGNSGHDVAGISLITTGVAELINSTVYDNNTIGSFGYAGGIEVGGGTVRLFNTIVAGNTAASANDNDIFGSIHSTSDYNLLGSNETSQAGSNNVFNDDPGLTALGYYGGPTLTHALLSTSPAIDAGDNAVALTYGLEDDQRGGDRIVDWDGIGGDRVDIGAVELAFGEIYS